MAVRIARPSESELEVAAFVAARNWENWRCCFETPAEQLPIYTCQDLFRKFVKEYGLLQGETRESREQLRDWMTKGDRVNKMIGSNSGSGVESLLREMQRDGFRCHRSFLSKVAAFSQPHIFVAYDRFARRGLVNLKIVTRQPNEYVTYLKAVRKLYVEIEKDIKEHLEGRTLPTNNETAFHLRVLDVYLMLSGNREIPIWSGDLLCSSRNIPSGCRLF